MPENLKALEVQVESAKRHLQGKQRALDDLHTSGHNRAKFNKIPCNDVNFCKIKDKHPQLMTDIRTLQLDLKELEQKYAKAKNDCDVFNASGVSSQKCAQD